MKVQEPLLFIPTGAVAAFFGYCALYRYIEVHAHTLGAYGAPFYAYMAVFVGLSAYAFRLAWKGWKGWAALYVPLTIGVTLIVLVRLFWLPFP